jgi:hypothetical protein
MYSLYFFVFFILFFNFCHSNNYINTFSDSYCNKLLENVLLTNKCVTFGSVGYQYCISSSIIFSTLTFKTTNLTCNFNNGYIFKTDSILNNCANDSSGYFYYSQDNNNSIIYPDCNIFMKNNSYIFNLNIILILAITILFIVF